MQSKSKEKEAKKHHGLKRHLTLVQTSIVESLGWPYLKTETVLLILFYLQMYKYSYDYVLYNWHFSNSTSQPIFFSYIDISYYQKYLSEIGFINILYTVMGIMTFYVFSFLYLLKPLFEGQLTNCLRKVMKILMELFTTVLFVPIVKTVATYIYCWNSSTVCVVKQLSSTVFIVSLVLLGLFSSVLLLQTTLKYEFLCGQLEKVRRHSNRGHCLLLIYVIANEFSLFIDNGVIMSVLITLQNLILLIYNLLIDEFITIKIKKIQFCFIFTNIYLLINTHYSLINTGNSPLLCWFISCPIIIAIVMLQHDLSIKFQLQNINKWITPTDMLRYCHGLRYLISKPDDFKHKMAMNGYCDIHRQKCQEPTCPIRTSQQKLNKLRNFLGPSSKNKADEVLMIEELIKKIYSQGVKFFPTNSTLEIEYALFLYGREMPEQALKELLQMDVKDASLDQYYKYHRLKYKIHHELSAKNVHTALDMLSEMEMNWKQEKFVNLLQKTAFTDLQFWGVLNEDHPDFLKLDQIGVNRMRLSQQVDTLYKEIANIGNNQRVTFLYVLFMINVNKFEEQFNDVYERIRQEFNLDDRITIEDWANSSNSIMLFNGQEDKFGNIADLNLSAASFLGYEKYELMNRNVTMILSNIFSSRLSEFLTGKQNDAPVIQNSQLQFITACLLQPSTETKYYLMKKNGYCIPVTRKVQVFNSMSRGFIYMSTFQPVKIEQQCFLLINPQGKIEGMSSSCISILGLDLKYMSFRENIDSVFPDVYGQLEKLVQQPIKKPLKDALLEEIVERAGIDDDILEAVLQIKAEMIEDLGYAIYFERQQPTIANMRINVSANTNFSLNMNLRNASATIVGRASFRQEEMLSDYDGWLKNMNSIADGDVMLEDRINYGQGIRVVRLYDNEIEIIEDSDDEGGMFQKKKEDVLQNDTLLKLNRKDYETIFQNKSQMLDFIKSYEAGRSIRIAMMIALFIHIALFTVVFQLFTIHNNQTVKNFNKLVYESMKIGQIGGVYSYSYSYELFQKQLSMIKYENVQQWMNSSIERLQKIKIQGFEPYLVTVRMTDNTTKTFFSDQFVQSYINNAQVMATSFGSARDLISLKTSATENANMSRQFIMNNGLLSYPQFVEHIDKTVIENQKQTSRNITEEAIIIASCYLTQILFFVIVIYLFYRVYEEKIKVLKVFLNIPEQHILLLSKRSERFLTSLHVDDNEMQEDEEAYLNQRSNKNSFAVKKKFKVIKRQHGIYFKFLIIPFIVQFFYVLSFTASFENLNFCRDGILYANYTSSGRRVLYDSLTKIQKYTSERNKDFQNPSSALINFYQKFFQSHYQTFVKQDSFHQYFIDVMMGDICSGSVKVKDSCNADYAQNGTLLMFTNMAVETAYQQFYIDMRQNYYWTYRVISQAHDILSNKLLQTQENLTKIAVRNILNYYFIFVFGMIGLFVLYGLPLINAHMTEINDTKKVLSLLPLSIAKQSEDVQSYFQEIILRKKYFFN